MAVNAAAVWRVRPSGNNANGGGYDSTISGAGTDYSQQNSPQATGTLGTSTASTTFTDASGVFTAAMVGNALHLVSGTGTTPGWYFVTAFTNSTTITLDRSPGTGSAAVWKLGGGWADFVTNTTSSGPVVAGNTIYILGSGVPNPSSYSFDYTPGAAFTSVGGSVSSGGGLVRYIGDPATPSGGMPCIQTPGNLFTGTIASLYFQNLWFVANAATGGAIIGVTNGEPVWVVGCVADQNGYDISFGTNAAPGTGHQTGQGPGKFFQCEVFSSTAKRSTNALIALVANHYGLEALYCNVHDCIGPAYSGLDAYNHLAWSIAANNGAQGVYFSYTNNQSDVHHNGCEFMTIDGNAGDGIFMDSASELGLAHVFNCIISNHTTGGTFGLDVATGSATANEFLREWLDYNVFFGNTTDTHNLNYASHDTHGGSNPYVGQSTENYTLA